MNLMKSKKNQYILALLISGTIWFLLDLFTKLWALSTEFVPFDFVKNWFYLIPALRNSGIAFGINIPGIVQIAGGVVIIYLLLKIGFDFFMKKKQSAMFHAIILGAVIGGGIGNLVDRIFYGRVPDFIVLRPFPVFNIADIGITVGLLILFATMLLESRHGGQTTSK